MQQNLKVRNNKWMLRMLWGILLLISVASGQKQVYIPRFMSADPNNPSSQWSLTRSEQTENYIILWEVGYGNTHPAQATGAYRVNMDLVKQTAERSFAYFVDTLRMVNKGSSLTDQYKQMIFILYTTEWSASGAGQDERVGSLHVSPSAANIPTVLSHEIAHSFQYMTGADVRTGGFRWGFGANGAGGNGFWEQVANWMAFKVYPEEQFRAGDFSRYIASNHLHILHERPRYANYFLPDYWAHKRGSYFMGRLWRETIRPEDPVETYKRLNQINQEAFNDEIFEHAALLTTWDIPAIRSQGANFIDRRPQVLMNRAGDDFWIVAPSVTIENYGYNSIRLNAPTVQTQVSVEFQGRAGASGYRVLNINQGGWRFGFVALLTNGTRVYSNMVALQYANGANPQGTLNFTVPANCSRLWLVVSGAPQQHWKHAWDDDDTNDEQWPYQVRFTNTNLLGEPNRTAPIPPSTNFTLAATVNGTGTVSPNSGSFAAGTSVTLSANAGAGFVFTGWSGDASGTTNPLTLAMSAHRSVVANFARPTVRTLNYTVEMQPLSDYTPVLLGLGDSLRAIFGLSTAQITTNYGSSILYFAIDANGTPNSTSTAIAPGHWYGANGQIVNFGEDARVYAELDMATLQAKIGQYPNRSNPGTNYTIRQALQFNRSLTEIIQINLVYNIRVTAPVVAINRGVNLDRNYWQSLLENPTSQLQIYDLRGRLILKASGTKLQSETLDLGALGIKQNGVYRLVILQNGEVKASRTEKLVK